MGGNLIGLEQIVGLEEAKEVITNDLTLRINNDKPQKLVLLEGPSGGGKTTLVEKVVEDFKRKHPTRFKYKELKTPDVTKHVTSTAETIADLFKKVRSECKKHVIVLFMDEADELLASRKDAGHIRTERTSNIMKELNNETTNLYIICATNRPKMIDRAVLERCSERIHCPLPTDEELKQLIDIYLPFLDQEPRTVLWKYIIGCEYRWSGRDLKHLSERLKDLKELKRLSDAGYKITAEDVTKQYNAILNSKKHLKDDYLED